MRIAAIRNFIAGLLLTALWWLRFAVASNITHSMDSQRLKQHSTRDYNSRWRISTGEEGTIQTFGPTYREIQAILRFEGGENGNAVDCCPIIEEMTEPTGGRNREEMYVELYRDSNNAQRFYEYSCRPDVLDKPCRFIDKKLMNQTRCVQKFSYSYAIVRDPTAKFHHAEIYKPEHRHRHKDNHFPTLGSGSPWTLDHIRVRSGCSCEVWPKPKRRRTMSLRMNKRKKNKMAKLRSKT